jgi:hypothetical protein
VTKSQSLTINLKNVSLIAFDQLEDVNSCIIIHSPDKRQLLSQTLRF